jgi:hypothetical protein
MDGEVQSMGARKMGRIGSWTRIKEGMRRRKRNVARHKKEFLVGKKELVG